VHLAEHVGLLDPLDDPPVLDPDVVEEAGFERALGGRRPIQPPGRRAADRAVSQRDIAVGKDLASSTRRSGRPFQTWRTDSFACPQSTNPWVNPTQFSR